MKKKGNMKKRFVIPLIAFLGFFVVLASVFVIATIQDTSEYTQEIVYGSDVCIYKNGELIQDCEHNVLYDTGAELIEDVFANEAASDAADWVGLCNATVGSAGCGTPTTGSSEPYEEYTSCGLSKAAGTIYDNGVGNWSVEYTFTASCNDLLTNVTQLLNGNADEFAGKEFTLVTLQSSDQLTVNWTVWVTSA